MLSRLGIGCEPFDDEACIRFRPWEVVLHSTLGKRDVDVGSDRLLTDPETGWCQFVVNNQCLSKYELIEQGSKLLGEWRGAKGAAGVGWRLIPIRRLPSRARFHARWV
jgi:hypothetical protein